MSHEVELIIQIIVIVAGSAAVAGFSRRLGLAAPIALVLVGVAVSFVPGLPAYTLEPEIALFLFLPPLLYSAAWQSSYLGFRANLRPIGLLSIGLVLFTTVVVGYVVHWMIPDIPLAAAFALGAIVAPPDAVAATAVGRELGLPRRMLTILGGESLVNDATALTAYRVAIAAAVGGGVTLLEAGGMFVLAAVGGVLVGFALAVPLHWIRQRITDPVLEIAVGLVVPFVAYIVAEELHTSGVLAVVVAGLYLGHRSTQTSSAARLQGESLWRMIDFILESVVFALIGLQLRIVLDELGARSLVTLLGWGLAVTVLVIALRFVWVFPATYLPRLLVRRLRDREPAPSPRSVTVISWAGMRGVVSLAAAFALAADFPARDLIVWLTFCVVVGTLVVQGLTLPWVIRRLGVTAEDSSADDLAEAAVGHRAAQASIARLDELAGGDGHHVVVAEQLRHTAEKRANSAWERLGSNPDETPATAYKRLRREMLAAEREVFVRARNDREVDDEVLRRVLRELDLEEVMLQRE